MAFWSRTPGRSETLRFSFSRGRRARLPRLELLEDRCLPAVGVSAFGQLPLAFEPNVGQASAGADFLSRGPGYTLALSGGNATLALHNTAGTDMIGMELLGAARSPGTGIGRLPGVSNHLEGNDPSRWHTDIPTYRGVVYQGIYPGVDVVYYGNQRQLEYDFTIQPGSDSGVVRLWFRGVTGLSVNAQGDLVLRTASGDVIEQAPVVYQQINGVRQGVVSRYVLQEGNTAGFALGAYDHARPLTIDPVLSYSTYLGGSAFDAASGIAVDAAGSAYVVGTTASTDFPTAAPFQGTSHGASVPGDTEVFVAKLNPTGTALMYSTYLGGTGPDAGQAIAVDGSGSASIAGRTGSSDFPTTAGAFQGVNGGGEDAFVARLNAAGSALLYSSYLGGAGTDQANGVAVDNSGGVYVAGTTASSTFPVTDSFRPGFGGGLEDAFVARFDTTASGNPSLVYSTYLGGEGDDRCNAIAVDAAGNATVTGSTDSASFFPTTGNAFQGTNRGFMDAFVSKLNPTGTNLLYSTLLGGTNSDEGLGIAVDGAGHAYVAGVTFSTDLPTASAFQPAAHGGEEGFVAKLDTPVGTPGALVYATYLGGTGSDAATAIAVDAGGDAYVTGRTQSTDFPTANALQAVLNAAAGFEGRANAFVTVLNASDTRLVYSTYLGGSGFDEGTGIAVDAAGSAYVAGFTNSSNFPTAQALQPQLNKAVPNTSGAFVSKLALAAPTISGLSPSSNIEGAGAFTLTVTGSGFVNTSVVRWNGGDLATTFVGPGTLQAVVPAALVAEEGNAAITVFNPTLGEGSSAPVSFSVTDAPLTDTTPAATINGIEGQANGSQVVATFSDANPNATAADFPIASVDWGDGQSSTGQVQPMVTAGAGAAFRVVASHSYAEEGTFTVRVQVTDVGGQVVRTQNTRFAVADALMTDMMIAPSFQVAEGTAYQGTNQSGLFASFQDGNPSAPESNFTASVDWGDGTSSAAQVRQRIGIGMMVPPGTFDVFAGSHTFVDEGTYAVRITVRDVGGQILTVNVTAQVVDAGLAKVTINGPLTASPGVSTGEQRVLEFFDQNLFALASDYDRVMINWGDGTTSAGAIRGFPSGGSAFDVVGSHTYAAAGTFTTQIFVHDRGGATLDVQGGSFEVQSLLLIPGQLTAVLSGPGPSFTLFAVSADHGLWRHEDASGWVRLGAPGTVRAISAAPEASGNPVVFAVTTDGGLARFNSRSGWSLLGAPGTIRSVSAGRGVDGLADAFVITGDGSFTEYRSSGWLRTPLALPGSVVSMSAVTQGRVFVVRSDGELLAHDDSFGWYPLTAAGFAESLDTVDDGQGIVTVLAVSRDHALWQHGDTSGWQRVGGPGTIRSVTGGEDPANRPDAFVLTTDSQFAGFVSGHWELLATAGEVKSAVGVSIGRVYFVTADGSILAHDDIFGQFRLTAPGFAGV